MGSAVALTPDRVVRVRVLVGVIVVCSWARSHGASLHPGVQIGTGEMLGVTL